jgi:hypothetical protein
MAQVILRYRSKAQILDYYTNYTTQSNYKVYVYIVKHNYVVVFDDICIYLIVGFIRHTMGMTHLKIIQHSIKKQFIHFPKEVGNYKNKQIVAVF